MMSSEIILLNYHFLLLIFNLVPLRHISTKTTTASVDVKYHNGKITGLLVSFFDFNLFFKNRNIFMKKKLYNGSVRIKVFKQ